MRVALVHEFLNQLGGAEKVLQNFLEVWPDATVHVIFYNKEKTHGEFEATKKKISFLNSWPMAQKHPRLFLALMPSAIESFKFDDFDVVVADSSSFAHGAKVSGKPFICYYNTPTRFLWTDANYIKQQKYSRILREAGSLILPQMRKWDLKASKRPDFLIANSANVQKRIEKFYGRGSVVIPPPVDTNFFHPIGEKQDYYLAASRLEPYKKVDLVVEAFGELGLPLKVVGTGTVFDQLKALAKPNIEFLGRVSDEDLRKYYSEAKAYIFPAEEDAGITVVEAQACGTPVLAYGVGGSLETIKEGVTGEFFREQSTLAIVNAVKNFNPQKYNPVEIRKNAQQYDKLIFQQKIKEFVESKVK